MNWGSLKYGIEAWFLRTCIVLYFSLLRFSFCNLYNRRWFYKMSDFSDRFIPIWKFEKIIDSCDEVDSCSFYVIVNLVFVKFLHIKYLLSKTINLMTFENHSCFESYPNCLTKIFRGSKSLLLDSFDLLLIRLFLLDVFFLLYLLLLLNYVHFRSDLFWNDFWEVWYHCFFSHWLWFFCSLLVLTKGVRVISSRKWFE